MYSLERTIDATVEPVTIAQAKAQCRVVTDQDDALIAMLITAARQHCEKQTGRSFLQQTWRLSLDRFPSIWRVQGSGVAREGQAYYGYGSSSYANLGLANAILLPQPNLIGIVSLTYLDASNTRQMLDPSLYATDFDSAPARLVPAVGTFWPYGSYPQPGAVQITYTAGYGNTPAAVPAMLQLAILGLVAHWYENREAVVMTNSTNAVTTVPVFVDALLAGESLPIFTFEN